MSDVFRLGFNDASEIGPGRGSRCSADPEAMTILAQLESDRQLHDEQLFKKPIPDDCTSNSCRCQAPHVRQVSIGDKAEQQQKAKEYRPRRRLETTGAKLVVQ